MIHLILLLLLKARHLKIRNRNAFILYKYSRYAMSV